MEIQGDIYIFCRFFFICKTKYLLEFQIFEIDYQEQWTFGEQLVLIES